MIEQKTIREIVDSLNIVSDMSKYDPDKTFKENGIDSLDVMTLFLTVEERFGQKFSEEDFGKIKTPSELLIVLNSSKQ